MDAESDERRDGADVAAAGAAGNGTAGAGATAVSDRLGSRAPQFIRRSRPLHLSWQVGIFLVGLAVVVTGVFLLPLPGPGWLVIFAGMAIWATEFVWAQLVLRWTKRKVTQAAEKTLDPRVRRRNLTLISIGLVIVVAGLSVYLWKYGMVMPWKVAG